MKTPVSILIVDDDTDDVELFCEAVKEVDCTILCLSAGNGEEALHMLNGKDNKPDFIFLDLNMPRLNGKQCLKQLKRDELLAHIPVIIYTTSKLKEDIEETRSLGAKSFLTKPRKLEDLKKAITLILEKKWEHINAAF